VDFAVIIDQRIVPSFAFSHPAAQHQLMIFTVFEVINNSD
jgi:hypothetical protein